MAHAEAPVFGPTAAAILALVGLTYSASVAGFIFARLALGFGEAGNFPAAIKVAAEWFPKKRARARHRALQLRHQHRRPGHAARRPVRSR